MLPAVMSFATTFSRYMPGGSGMDSWKIEDRAAASCRNCCGVSTVTVRSKLHDLGEPTQGHQQIHVGFDLSAPGGALISPLTITLSTEASQIQLGPDQVKFLGLGDMPLYRQLNGLPPFGK